VLKALLTKADRVLIGGAMSYTLLKAQGINIGQSLFEESYLDVAKELLAIGKDKIVLPIDHIVTQKVVAGGPSEVQKNILSDFIGVDIGPETIDLYVAEINKAQTILWNGPMGVFEIPEFARGTLAIAAALAASKAVTVAGGGDTLAAIHLSKLGDKFTHLSTGGGATLEYIEMGSLPGVEALSNRTVAPASFTCSCDD
jgi:phosphoglycerate kinase